MHCLSLCKPFDMSHFTTSSILQKRTMFGHVTEISQQIKTWFAIHPP